MRRKVLLVFSVVASVVWTSGCFHDRGMLAADPDLLQAVAQSGGEEETLVRAQKPDAAAPSQGTPLDQPPERATEVLKLPAAARIRVTVNGEAILDEEIKAASYQALAATRNLPEPERGKKQMEIWYSARDQLIDREVVLQDAFARFSNNKNTAKLLEKLKDAATKEFERSWVKAVKEALHAKTDEEFKEMLLAQGIALEMYKRQWERNFMAMEYLRSRVGGGIEHQTGHPQIVEYYETHPDEFQTTDLVEWQDLFIDASRHANRDAARRFADDLVSRTRSGQDFAKLAKEFDNGDSSLRENALGTGQKRGEIRPVEAEPVLFQLKDGEVGPLVEIPTGFHIVRVVKRTYAGMVPFDEKIQKAIKEKLRNELGQREMKRYVNDLKRKAIIEYSRMTE